MELGKRIIEIRKQHGLTQEEFAERYHVTRQTISNWENGKSSPDLETLVSMSEDFNVSLDAMLKGDKEMVRKITREQKHGRNFILRLSMVVLCLVLIVAGLYVIGNTVHPLNPDDYDVVVKKITRDDGTIDEYEIVVTSDYKMSGWFIDSGENGALTLEVWRSNADLFNDRGYNRITCVWSEDFDKIYDSNAYNEGNIDDAIVWETGQ
ncbi:MAG: helix-turn-helix domain-containing protein [Clostridiales bacterium]|nr:helix-turn-helix domain-containing protein [Clostridiales bacterium]